MKIEQARQFADQALETLMAALEQGHSETLETYLSTIAKFRRYSWNNVLLIATQKPSATHVAGFHAWRKLGRHVRKGEKGIMILAPIVYRKRADERGGEKETEQPTGVRGFRAVHVFDLSQTDGEPIAEFATVTGDPKDYTERLTELVRTDGDRARILGSHRARQGSVEGQNDRALTRPLAGGELRCAGA